MSAKTLRNLLTALVILVVGVVVAMALVKMGKKPERQTPPASRPVVSAFLAGPLVAQVTSHPALSDFSVKQFGIMEEFTAICRGPVGEMAAA